MAARPTHMTRVLQRILRRRDPDPDDEPQLESADHEQEGPDTTTLHEGDVEADRGPLAPAASFRTRGAMRRRLRYLRQARELGFRDLGGLVFDQHKFDRQNVDLVRGKVSALAAVDAELRVLEEALGEKRDITELREPGITACPRCGTLHGSDANFCPSCGLALSGARTIAADVGEGVHDARPGGSALPSGTEPDAPEHERDGREYGRREPDPREDASRTGTEQPTAVVRPSDRPDA